MTVWTPGATLFGRILLAFCAAAWGVVADVCGEQSRADTASVYHFSCAWASLTADFADRDNLPQSPDPPAEWYRTDADGRYVNHGWGPNADALPAPAVPQGAGCDSATWRRERIVAVSLRYVNTPGNPLALQYRHHHIPGWDPSSTTYAGAVPENPDPDAPPDSTAWAAGAGLDCSNLTAWVYNYGLGIKFGGNVHRQWEGTAGPMGLRISAAGPFEPGDLIFLHPNGDQSQASHVVIYIDEEHIIDSRVNAQSLAGVQVRQRRGWYRDAVLGAWRPID